MSLISNLKPGGKHGVPDSERRDPIGFLVAGLNRLAQSDVIDRLGLRRQTEQVVFNVTRTGFKTITNASRTFARSGKKGAPGTHPAPTAGTGPFDLTPTEDEQMLVDLVSEFAAEVVRPAASAADAACAAPDELLKSSLEIGLPILGVPEALGGISEERSAMAGTLVAEALAKGDMGLAVATLAPGSVATAIGLWGTDEQQQTYLPAFTGNEVPAAALALNEPTVLFDVLDPSTTATRSGGGYVLNGTKSLVARGDQAELFVVGANLDGKPVLFLVESSTEGLAIEGDPAMGVRAASMTKLELKDVKVPAEAVLGETDGSTYAECVRLSRLAWCALAVGTAQAVLDYVTPYVKEREAFGEPIAHRQSVAFMVANIAIELQAMRLLTYRAAARAAAGKNFSKQVALARKLCADKGMQIGNDGVQLLGGHGYVKEHPVERWYRDLRAIGIMEGTVLV
ncbi:acyl-CoA dehydrogenase family protein [Nocardioides bizhenqiangii]|uniref:Acyl-CoA dehydrogenase family protein n=1 Tax=Nocardioides bizhenqiangii TaxID=3095076 RepID=A0ABZ0ZJE8_9ACTN|nr:MULTISPECIES: acyl-CoA dehydrogenase family protein [unclassified Nocardioides]MDZ5620248.1 acyl-CoA dehydrogenase family protein [Nocardioides sp. HM23]WQQ24624.1 acyl-CoA dehydrogenase family protein [Nocardioides sp. HM61]